MTIFKSLRTSILSVMSSTTSTSKWLLTVTASMWHNLHVVDSLGQILKRAENTINHYGNKTTEERCVIQLLISSKVAPQKFCRYCGKSEGIVDNLQILQKICRYCIKICWHCRKYPGSKESVQKICRYCRKWAENLQVLQKMCKKSAAIAESMQVLQNSSWTEYL